MSKRPAVKLGADLEPRVDGGRVLATAVDTNFRPHATSVPELSVIAGIYLDSLRSGRRPIQALMERFNVDRDSAKGWPTMCRTAGLLPPRDQPQIVTVPDETSHRYRLVD
jgi:hypothetical protein